MNYAQRIRQARGNPEAFLILAEGIDELLASRGGGAPASTSSEWDQWPARGETQPASDPDPNAPGPFDVIKVTIDPADLSRAREAYRQAEINWEGMQTRGPLAGQNADQWNEEKTSALMEMRRAELKVRQMEDPGAILNNAGFIPGAGDLTHSSEQDGKLIVDLPTADATRQAARRRLAEAIDLPGFFPTIYRTGEAREGIIRAFELGGPIWLAANGQFDNAPPVIMQMPESVRTAFVEDVRMDSERMAFELSRELFKDADPDHLDNAANNIESMVARGGQVYEGKGER